MSHPLVQQYPITSEEIIQLENDRISAIDDIIRTCSNQLARESGSSMSEEAVAVLRLKMMVNSVKTIHDQEGEADQQEIALSAVYSNKVDSANAKWCRWTPSASFSFTVSNKAAFGKVKPGQFMYVDLIPTDKDSI
jgi:hypothetical protein